MLEVCVLGAGVIGTTTAYELAKDGHRVTVIDRQPGPGLETSFANGGQISANHATPWATPEALKKAFQWLGRETSPLIIRPRLDPDLFFWMLRFLSNCRAAKVPVNTERALRVALYSRDRLARLRKDLGLDYHQTLRGVLHLYRSEKDLDDARAQAESMTKMGCKRDILNRDEVYQLEPSLRHSSEPIVGGILSPDDESGDAFAFTDQIEAAAKGLGAHFLYNHAITGLSTDKGCVTGVETDQGTIGADVFVVCLGSFGPALLKPLGVMLPVYPAKGYSLSLEIGPDDIAPTLPLIDDEFKIVYSRLGDTLRIAGTAEFCGFDLSPNPKREAMILSKAFGFFPGLNDGRLAEPWCGLRPMTPDQVPVIGRTVFENLVLNTGHGTLGWTMAAGSARIVADLVNGRTPSVDLTGLGLERF